MGITKTLARKGRLDAGIHYILNGDKTGARVLTAHLDCCPRTLPANDLSWSRCPVVCPQGHPG